MEVESTGASMNGASGAKNKVLFVILGALGVAIVGLVIAIVVVKSVPKGGEKPHEPVAEIDDSAYREVEEYKVKVLEEFGYVTLENKEAILNKYKEYANATDDSELKAIINTAYYQTLMLYDYDKTYEKEVLENLIEIDRVLNDVSSAVNVANASAYYDNEEISGKYNVIINERNGDTSMGGEG